jgi:quinol monooxygenase YgiN
MGRIVVVAYRPKPGRADDLVRLTARHVAVLRQEGLATDRQPISMQAADGTVVEVFEWASADAIESAHSNEAVQALWRRYAEVCDYVPIADLPEAARLFSEFTPLPVL